MEKNNITLLNEENNTGNSSSLCLVYNSDGRRTMCTFLGASSDLSIKDINLNFQGKQSYIFGRIFVGNTRRKKYF